MMHFSSDAVSVGASIAAVSVGASIATTTASGGTATAAGAAAASCAELLFDELVLPDHQASVPRAAAATSDGEVDIPFAIKNGLLFFFLLGTSFFVRARLACATSPCVFPTLECPRFFIVQPMWCPFLYFGFAHALHLPSAQAKTFTLHVKRSFQHVQSAQKNLFAFFEKLPCIFALPCIDCERPGMCVAHTQHTCDSHFEQGRKE